jgi:hypothetical protein
MDDNPLRRKVPAAPSGQPKIWAEGSQRPPFVPRAFAAGCLYYAREAVAPVLGILARATARLATTLAQGNYRIPADRMGRAEPFVPAYTRVAGWIMALADILAQGGFVAHSDPVRAATLRASVPPLDWAQILPTEAPAAPSQPAAGAITDPALTEPVVLAEPAPMPVEPDDPLASIRADLADSAHSAHPANTSSKSTKPPRAAPGPASAPGPRSPLADGLIDATGFALGWATSIIALPYGALRAAWAHISGEDLRKLTPPG